MCPSHYWPLLRSLAHWTIIVSIVTQWWQLTMMPRVLVLQMDYHRCLLTPKVSSQDSFYLRKFRTYLFGVYSANEDILNCFFFYNESIGRRGPNEVILLLNYVLETLIERYRTFHNLILWADNSPAQFAFYFFMWTPFSEMEGFFE